jgi:YD repeat-containing protein
MSHDQNAADQRIDDVENQRELHLLLPNNRGKWVRSILHGQTAYLICINLCNRRELLTRKPGHNRGTSTTYTYNADDSVLSVTDARGAAATYAYNGRHLTTRVTYSASGGISISAPVTYGYDSASNRS